MMPTRAFDDVGIVATGVDSARTLETDVKVGVKEFCWSCETIKIACCRIFGFAKSWSSITTFGIDFEFAILILLLLFLFELSVII